jgi:hypothetical protein
MSATKDFGQPGVRRNELDDPTQTIRPNVALRFLEVRSPSWQEESNCLCAIAQEAHGIQ